MSFQHLSNPGLLKEATHFTTPLDVLNQEGLTHRLGTLSTLRTEAEWRTRDDSRGKTFRKAAAQIVRAINKEAARVEAELTSRFPGWDAEAQAAAQVGPGPKLDIRAAAERAVKRFTAETGIPAEVEPAAPKGWDKVETSTEDTPKLDMIATAHIFANPQPVPPPPTHRAYPLTFSIDHAELATILAALRYYQEQGMGEPDNRSDAIHDIATDGGDEISLDADAIDQLCERINSGPGIQDNDSLKPHHADNLRRAELGGALDPRNDRDDEDEDELEDEEEAPAVVPVLGIVTSGLKNPRTATLVALFIAAFCYIASHGHFQ